MIKSIKIKLMFLSILPVLITILLIGFFSIKLSLDNSNKSLKELLQFGETKFCCFFSINLFRQMYISLRGTVIT